MRKRRQAVAAIAVAISLSLSLLSCGGHKETSRGYVADSSQDKPTELPIPAIPPEFDTPELRIKYVANAYWDSLDFTNHSLSLDTAFMEQSFSNFISFLQHQQNSLHPMCNLVDKASADTEATLFLWEIADKYLNNPNSPMRNGELYRSFLLALSDSPAIDSDYRGKLDHQTLVANLNRPGALANDFHFITRHGTKDTLRKHAAGKITLLIFYDPSCEQCSGIMKEIAASEMPGGLEVIAIDAEEDKDLWQRTAPDMPEGWTVGFASDAIKDNLMYHLPAMPTIYLLDNECRVLLKDPHPATAIATAASILTAQP